MILLNTDIDFTSPSGGILQDIDHIEFIPSGVGFLPGGESPNLPSGSLWLRPNDGQLERLNYQGTSGIFDARNTEGYAIYTTTTTQAFGFGAGIVTFETVVLEDSQFITQENTTTFRIQVQGLWRVTYAARFDTPATGSLGTIRAGFSQYSPFRSMALTRNEAFIASNGDQGGGCVYADVIVFLQRPAQIQLELLGRIGLDTNLVEAMFTFELIRPDSQAPF